MARTLRLLILASLASMTLTSCAAQLSAKKEMGQNQSPTSQPTSTATASLPTQQQGTLNVDLDKTQINDRYLSYFGFALCVVVLVLQSYLGHRRAVQRIRSGST